MENRMYVGLVSLCFCDSYFLFASFTTNYSCIIYLLLYALKLQH